MRILIKANFFLILAIVSTQSTATSLSTDLSLALTETNLDHLRDDYKIWSSIPDNALETKTFVSESITKKIIKLSILASPIDEVMTPKLEVLCLIKKHPDTYRHHGHKNLSMLAEQYLNRVHIEVNEKIEASQKILYGAGCYVSPNRSSTNL